MDKDSPSYVIPAGPCPFERCRDQVVHCDGACHGLDPGGHPLLVLPKVRKDFDAGLCLSCQGGLCNTGTFCVALEAAHPWST